MVKSIFLQDGKKFLLMMKIMRGLINIFGQNLM